MPSDSVLIAGMSTFGVVVTALLSYLSYVTVMTRRHARTIRAEVQNSHQVNLRDDLDDKFEGLAVLVKTVILDVGGMKSDIRNIRKDASNDRQTAIEAIAAERERILKLERTLTPTQLQRLRNKSKE